MSGYREIAKEYSLDEDEKGATAVRGFAQDPNGVDTLPEIGDPFDQDNTYLVCKRRRKTKFQGTPAVDYYICEYGTQALDKSDAPFDQLTRNLNVSGEYLNIGKAWLNKDTNTKSENDVYKRIVSTTFTIPKVFRSWGTLLSRVMLAVGKVNSATFEGQAAGVVLFTGVTSQEFFDSQKRKKWKAEFSFEGRRPGWNYVWQDKQGAFVQVTKPVLYESYDLRSLFTNG